eukprot:s2874_g7.t4
MARWHFSSLLRQYVSYLGWEGFKKASGVAQYTSASFGHAAQLARKFHTSKGSLTLAGKILVQQSSGLVEASPCSDMSMDLQANPVNEILYVSFNQDFTCFVCGTESGFRVYSADPFHLTFRRDFEDGSGLGVVCMLELLWLNSF